MNELSSRSYQGKAALLNLDRDSVERVENVGSCPARRALIPGKDVLNEAHVDDAHAPLEVLSPRRHNRGEGHPAQADHGLGLEVTE